METASTDVLPIIATLIFFLLVFSYVYFAFFHNMHRRFPDPCLPAWDPRQMRYFGTYQIPKEVWQYITQTVPADSILWVRDKSYFCQQDLMSFKPAAYDWYEKKGKDLQYPLFHLQFRLWLTDDNRERLMNLQPDQTLMHACIYDADRVLFHLRFNDQKGIYDLHFAPELGKALNGFFYGAV